MADPLDVILCPACAAECEAARDEAEGFWFCFCRCGYSIEDAHDDPPPTILALIEGHPASWIADGVDLAVLLPEIARRMGVARG